MKLFSDISFTFIFCQSLFVCTYLYSKGFLLTRESIEEFSSCSDFQNDRNLDDSSCLQPKYKKLIVMIIDALRYDFVSDDTSKSAIYGNNFAVVKKKLQTEPTNSKLFKFIADPPTTTMQRLKGLTTGSLPTFIDASKNFASAQIREDNLIDQLLHAGKRMVVLGDDTWGNLYPHQFHRSFLAPSFNVKDLHSVDNGIISNLFPEIRKDNWDVIIAHFLGVDHCGHTFGPDTSQMQLKLLQMNEVIGHIIDKIDNETLFLVLGDHGMTSTGDHGGDSQLEVESALFVHSKIPIFQSVTSKIHEHVSQIDLVPTISILLGIPIPFSNIGKIIESMIEFGISQNVDKAYIINVLQVHRYLSMYQNSTGEIKPDKWNQLETAYNLFLTDSVPTSKSRYALNYLQIARGVCEESWAKFNLVTMTTCVISIAILIGVAFSLNFSQVLDAKNSLVCCISIQFVFVIAIFINLYAIILCPLLFLYFMRGNLLFPIKIICLENILVLLFCFCSFSNSFLLSEASVCVYLITTVLLCQFLALVQWKTKTLSKLKKHYTINVIILKFWPLYLPVCILTVLLRMPYKFWYCREEQLNCQTNDFLHTPLSILTPELRNLRFFVVITALSIYLILLKYWLNRNSNISGSVANILGGILSWICFGCIVVQWILDSFPEISFKSDYSFLIPRIVYFSAVFVYLYLLYNPMLVHTVDKSKKYIRRSQLIPHLVSKLCDSKSDTQPKLMVYGLITGFSSVVLLNTSYIMLVTFLLSTDGLALGSCLVSVSAFVFLFVHSYFVITKPSLTTLFEVNKLSIFVWFLLCIQGFYTSGHQATFPSIKWSSAFVGFDGTNQNVASILVGFNTFSSHILFGFTLSLLFIAPFSMGAIFPKIMSSAGVSEFEKGEYLISLHQNKSKQTLQEISIIYVTLHAVKLLFTIIASFMLRRHLMVWKIFAPKFVFEALGFFVTCVSVLLGQLLVFRTIKSYENWHKTYAVTEVLPSYRADK